MSRSEVTIAATHPAPSERLATAHGAMPTKERRRDRFPAMDTFLASASRHNASVNEPRCLGARAARGRARPGPRFAHEPGVGAKPVELKSKLYGSAYAVKPSWRTIWDNVPLTSTRPGERARAGPSLIRPRSPPRSRSA